MSNPEQNVLDAIDELVDWQIAEGIRRGEYDPDSSCALDAICLSEALAVVRYLIMGQAAERVLDNLSTTRRSEIAPTPAAPADMPR